MKAGGAVFWALPVLHPAYVLRTGGTREDNPAYCLLRNALALATVMTTWKPPDITDLSHLVTDVEVVYDLKHQLRRLLSAPEVGLDIETDSLDPWECQYGVLSASISDGNKTVAFPLHHPEHPSPGNEQELRTFLRQYQGRVVAHNAAFELTWMYQLYGTNNVLRSVEWHDSMCAVRHKLDRESPLALDDACRIYLGSRIKALTGVHPTEWRNVGLTQLLRYNGVDAASCLLLAQKLVLHEPVEPIEYRRLREAVVTTSLMTRHGLPLDTDLTTTYAEAAQSKLQRLKQLFQDLPDVLLYSRGTGKMVDPSSPAQISKFFVHCGLLSTESGTDESLLRELKHPAAKIILDIRHLEKLASTYLRSWLKLVGKDGALHPKYTVALTATGRLSSEHPNIQNAPKRRDSYIRECIKPASGLEMLVLDYSQIEIRVIAMLSQDPTLVQELWARKDLHLYWADRVEALYPQILDRIGCDLAITDSTAIHKALRNEIKRGITFALPYGASRNTPAKILQIPASIGYQLASEYWQRYPVLQRWQETMRKQYYRQGCVVIPSTQRRRAGLLWGNEPINNPVQGTASDLVVAAMTRLAKHSRSEADFALLPRINIHDDLTFFIPADTYQQYGSVIAKEMVRIVHPLINVPLEVEASHGPDWYHQTTFATYSSIDFGHRRRRRACAAAVSQISPQEFLGGSWTECSSRGTQTPAEQ